MMPRLQPCLDPPVIEVGASLRAPLSDELRRQVQALLDDGARHIVVDLAGVAAVDAAGVGELTAVYNAVNAAGGVLHVIHLQSRPRHVLAVVGLLGVLATDSE